MALVWHYGFLNLTLLWHYENPRILRLATGPVARPPAAGALLPAAGARLLPSRGAPARRRGPFARCQGAPASQPGPIWLGPARPGPAQPGPARPGSAQLGPARPGLSRPGSARPPPKKNRPLQEDNKKSPNIVSHAFSTHKGSADIQ